jgi:putative endonuclease
MRKSAKIFWCLFFRILDLLRDSGFRFIRVREDWKLDTHNSFMKKTDWYLYFIRCRNGSLYTGISTNVDRRFQQHQNPGRGGSKYLKGRGPLVLVFQSKVGAFSLALKVERKVKKLPKNKKEKIWQDSPYLAEIIQKITSGAKPVSTGKECAGG